ncbi:hypothetical protein C3L23_07790 [Nautilia sp. PV-1]|uniref:MarC family protein n=1 Tax=Nautilia sp. PV-1 TaxID=2579250 RepID=UPI000FD9BEE6|nr:MarC family protein [Nautilia sp. PV-1]AZV47177.1 hypothetical protein C3L23_07790 [Nautilia sp. PV-1]
MISKIFIDTLILITVFNPLEAAIVLLSIRNPYDNDTKIAFISSLTVFVLSFIILFVSSFLFTHIHSDILPGNETLYINVVKIIGGILLFFVGWIMINGKRASNMVLNKKEKKFAKEKEEIAIIPMAVPVILGPGVFTVLLVLGDRAKNTISKEELFISLVLSMLVMYLTLKYAEKIIKFLGLHGIKIISLLTGLFIMFISIIFFINGLKGILSFM